jgi:type III secretion protein L
LRLFTLKKIGKEVFSKGKIIPSEMIEEIINVQDLAKDLEQFLEEEKVRQQEAYEAKKLEGFEAGYQEGLTKFNEWIVHFDAMTRETKHEAQKSIVPIALKAAQKIVSEQIRLHPETVVSIVKNALSAVSQHKKFRILVSKIDKDALEAGKPEIQNILPQLEVLEIEARSDIPQGSCRIETEKGVINCDMDRQWKALEEAFRRMQQKNEE